MLSGLTEQYQTGQQLAPSSLRWPRRPGSKPRAPPPSLLFSFHYPMTLLPCCLPGPLAAVFLQLVAQGDSVFLSCAVHKRVHGLCLVALEGLFGVPQVVLKQREGGLSPDQHALDLDVLVSGAEPLLLGTLVTRHPSILCSGLRRFTGCYAKRYRHCRVWHALLTYHLGHPIQVCAWLQ